MDDACMNHYEKQLYTVFKTFDVDNEEALDRAAVLQLCDALQLEARGAALVDSLFERRAERVTFATFRNGLLSVLGASAPAEPEPEPAAPEPVEPEPAHSDDDSSGREVAPKFVFGSKKYGRRSRPVRGVDEPAAPRAASASRLDADADAARRPRMRYKRSASAMEARADARLDHDRRIDRAQAVALCRDLRMDSIDPRLVDRIFEDSPAEETTVGEFFDRLNAALTSLASTTERAASPGVSSGAAPDAEDDDSESALPGEAVAEAWERAGVRRPRRLLAELGFTAATLSPPELERALDDELRALPAARDDRLDARPLLQQAALALSRLRQHRARARAAAAVAERDKLRADLAEANRRARLLAQDVDENHARLETERQAALRQLEARHAETARAAAEDRAAERERAASARAELEAEVARRGDAEARLRAELAALRLSAEQLERRASAAEERAATAERERARAEDETRAAAERERHAAERRLAELSALELQLEELRAEGARLRDRADELQAELEARAAERGPAAPLAAGTSWRDEADADLDADAPLAPDPIDDGDSCRSSASPRSPQPAAPCARCAGLDVSAPAADAATQTDNTPDDLRLEELQQKHQAEKEDLNNLIAELEASLEALREEYERCEEYWAGKLADERAQAGAEAAAGDERLAELLRRVAEYEAQFRPQLPALLETEHEAQYDQLAQEFAAYKAEAARELESARAAAAAAPACSCRQHSSVARPASAGAPRSSPPPQSAEGAGAGGRAPQQQHAPGPGAGAGAGAGTGTGSCSGWACAGWAAAAGAAAALRARAAHAEHAAARLLQRLQAADALVADLYRENCQLQHHAPLPRAADRRLL